MAVFWTDELNLDYIAMRTARPRVPVSVMAAHFGTTVAAIYAHGRVIKCLVQDRRAWTPDEVEQLRARVKNLEPDSAIAAALNRSVQSVRWKLDDLGLTGLRDTKWSADAVGRAIALAAAGEDLGTIATAVGRQVAGVSDKLRAMKVPFVSRRRVPQRAARQAKPRAERLRLPLTDEQKALITARLGKESLRAIAGALGIGTTTMAQRAAVDGFVIGTSQRRIGQALTLEVLAPLVQEGLSLAAIGKRLGRDPRRVQRALDELGLAIVKPAPRPARAAVARVKVVKPAKAARAVKPRRDATAKPRLVSRPSAPAPKLVTVSATPAAARPTVAAQPRRWNSAGGGKVVPVRFDDAQVNEAVARFIAERGVTRATGPTDPVEALVTEARRLGYIVVRDGGGFTVDGRMRFKTVPEFEGFVAQRRMALAS